VALAGISGGGAKVVRIATTGAATLHDVPALGEGSTGVSLALTSDGGVIVIGNAGGDTIIAKLDAAGTQLWSRTWRMSDGRTVVSRAVTVDAAGVIRIGGHTGSASGNPADFFVASFDQTTGNLIAARTRDVGLNLAEFSARLGVTMEPTGRTLITGQTSTGTPGDNDFAVAVFDGNDANLDWSARWANPINPARDDRAAVIASLPSGGMVVVGRSDGGSTGNDLATVVLTPPRLGCDDIDFNNNDVFPEEQDVIDFFNVLAGADCPACNDIDFNNNEVFPEEQDVIDFFNVLAGGTC
jgi:outer membrane protein assembly factor BamB